MYFAENYKKPTACLPPTPHFVRNFPQRGRKLIRDLSTQFLLSLGEIANTVSRWGISSEPRPNSVLRLPPQLMVLLTQLLFPFLP